MPSGGKRPGAGRPRKNAAQARTFEATAPTLDRPSVWIASIDARKEATAFDRVTLMKSARWAVNNSGLACRIVRGVARFAVGNGLVPQAQSSSAEFNKLAERVFDDRYGNVPWAFDRAGALDFYTAQSALVESMIADGDVFAQLVRSKNDLPMVRFFGGEFVGDNSFTNSDNIHDGVIHDSENRPIAYRVNQDPSGLSKGFTDVPADDIIHLRRVHRLGYLRGISWLGPAIARIVDVREALDNELAAAKLNSKIAFTIETEEAGRVGLGSNIRTANIGTDESYKIDKLFPGVGHVQLKQGEKLAAHEFNRPNTNLSEFVDYLTREIAYSIGVSPEVIWSMSGLGGTASRAALQDADTFFGGVRLIIEQQFCVRFWRYAVWHMIQSGEIPFVDDWFRVRFVPPPKVSVDFGRDSKAMLELVRNGLLSPRAYFNALGQDVDDETDDIIRGTARRKKRIAEIAEEEGVPLTYQEVFPPAPGAAAPDPVTDGETESDGTAEMAAEVEKVKLRMDAYGVGVRAGAITPNNEDEAEFRNNLGLPTMNSNVNKAWEEDGGVRRPITLVGREGGLPGQSAPEDAPPSEE